MAIATTVDRFWSVDIWYRNESGQTSGFGCSRETEEEARAERAAMERYYRDLGYTLVESDLAQCCSQCSGTGEVLTKVRKRAVFGVRVKCPACKGKDSRFISASLEG